MINPATMAAAGIFYVTSDEYGTETCVSMTQLKQRGGRAETFQMRPVDAAHLTEIKCASDTLRIA